MHELYHSHLFDAPDGAEHQGPSLGVQRFDLGWWGTFMRVAKQGVFGKLEEVHQSFIHDICGFLAQERSDQRQREQASATRSLQP